MDTYFSGHLTTVKDGSLGDEEVIVSQLFTVMKFFTFNQLNPFTRVV